MYTELELIIIITCAVLFIGIYIYRKANGEMWYGINWNNVFRTILKFFK